MSDVLFEPVLMNYGNTEWINSNIENLCKFGEDDINEGLWSTEEVFKITLNNENSYLYIICRSSLLKGYWDEYMEHLGDDNDKLVANKEMKSKSNKLYETLFSLIKVTLLEDTWTPGGEQFCFTDFGRQVALLLEKKLELSHTPDVNVSKDSDTEYSWHT